ncbi:MAG: septum formation initiator family protein [Actinomycetales bacterium]|nr:septum formation initiator family protein [Actinomycetales bacterium]
MSSPRRPAAPRSGAPRNGAARASGRPASRRPGAPRASAARPASRATGASATGSTTGQISRRTEEAHQPPARLLSIRSLVLLVVIGFAFSLVVPTVRSFLAQRADVAALERQVEDARTQDADLKAERKRWKDPAFVAAQARERIAYVLPGEVAYRVVDPESATPTVVDEPVEPETPASGILTPATDQPWFASVWESVQIAGGVPDGEVVGTEAASATEDSATGEAEETDPTAEGES